MGGAGASSSGGGGGGGERDAWEAASLVCRVATVGLSLASAIMTVASTQCVYRPDDDGNGSPAGAASYSDYGSFKYSALASLVSTVLQGVAIWLEVVGKEKWAKTVELIDKLVLALTSTSAPLLLAVDDVTSCGPPRAGGRSNGARRQPKRLDDGKLRVAALLSLGSLGAAASNEVVKKLIKRHMTLKSASLSGAGGFSFVPPPSPPPPPPPLPPPPPAPCSCSCPTVITTPCCCDCENRYDPCSASTT